MENNIVNKYELFKSGKREYTLAIVWMLWGVILFFELLSDVLENFLHSTIKTPIPSISYTPPGYFFIYFTYQSNILILLFIIAFAVVTFTKQKNAFTKFLYTVVHNKSTVVALTLYMVLTFLVALVILTGFNNFTWSDDAFIVHVITPLVMISMFFFIPTFDKKYTWKNVIYFIIYPFTYVVLVTLIGSFVKYNNINPDPEKGGLRWAFPYEFLNWHDHGWPQYFGYVVGLIAVFSAIGWGLGLWKGKIDKMFSKVS